MCSNLAKILHEPKEDQKFLFGSSSFEMKFAAGLGKEKHMEWSSVSKVVSIARCLLAAESKVSINFTNHVLMSLLQENSSFRLPSCSLLVSSSLFIFN